MGYLLDKYKGAATTTPELGGGYLSRKYQPPMTGPTTESLENIEKYKSDLMEYGIEPPKQKNVLGTVNKVLDILRTGEYAVGGLMAGKGLITGIREKISPSEVLGITPKETKSFWGTMKQPEFYGALALDILLDPITYLTFGFGGAVKLMTSGGGKILNKSGQQLLKKSVAYFGADGARRMMATRIMREGGEKYLAKGGLKFMGKEFLPRNIVQAPFKGIDWAMERAPLTGMAYKGIKDLTKKAFKPFAKIEELPAQMGGNGKFESIILSTQKGIRGETCRQLEYVGKLGNKAYKSGLKEPGRQVMNALEFDVRSGNKVLGDIADYMEEGLKGMGFAEKKRGILGAGVRVEIPGYQRHLLTKEGREFLETKGRIIQQEFVNNIKQFRVKTPFAKKRKLGGTVNEINNLYKQKYGVKLFEEDAFKAFAQRTIENVRAVKLYDMFQKMVDERIAIRAPMVPTAVKAIGKPTKIVRKTLDETVIDGIRFIKSKAPQLDGFLIPEPIAKHLDMTYDLIKSDEVSRSFLGLYDKILRYWKLSVTGLFPAFHTRNFIGGMWNNWLAGLWKPKWYFEGDNLAKGKNLNKLYTTPTGEKIYGSQLVREVENMGVSGMPGQVDIMKTTEEMIRMGKAVQVKNALNYPRAFMEAVEDRLRMPLYLFRRIEKGDTAEEAAKWVFKFHFDYAPEGFTAFERNVMRRAIPFYTWTRHNVPLQIEQVLKQPGKYASLEKARRNFEKTSGSLAIEEQEYLPEWMKEMFLFRLPGESQEGLPRYLQLDLPMEDIGKLPFTESGRREIISLLSPFIKYPIERIANRNLYFGSEIVRADRPKEYQTAKAMEALKYLPQPIKDYLNFKETKLKDSRTGKFVTRYEMDALKLHAIRSVLAGRFYSTVAQATDSELDAWMKLSRILGGVPVRPIDMEEEKYNRAKQQENILRDLTNYLKRRGAIPYKGKKIPVKGGHLLNKYGGVD